MSSTTGTLSAKYHVKLCNFRVIFTNEFRGRYTPILKCLWEKESFKFSSGAGIKEVSFSDVKEFEFETRFFKSLEKRFFVGKSLLLLFIDYSYNIHTYNSGNM